MVDELSSCCHADSAHAAGVLAVSAAQCHVARNVHAVLTAEVTLPLAPLPTAVLEAPSNNECGCDNTLSRRLTAAKVLQGVAQHPNAIARAQLPRALASAAAFLTRLDADWEAFWQLNIASGQDSGCSRSDSDSDCMSGTGHATAAAEPHRTCSYSRWCGCDGGIANRGTSGSGSGTCSSSCGAASSSQQQPTKAVLIQTEHFALSCAAGLSGTVALLRACDARHSMACTASVDSITPAARSITATVQHTLERLAALPHSQVSFALLPLLAVLPANAGEGEEELCLAMTVLAPDDYAQCGRAAASCYGEAALASKSAVLLTDTEGSAQNDSATCSGLYSAAVAALQQMLDVHRLPASYLWPVVDVLVAASSTLSDCEPGRIPAAADVRVMSSAMWRVQQQLDGLRSGGSDCNGDAPEVQLLKAQRVDSTIIKLLLAPLVDGNRLASLDTAAVAEILAALAQRLAWGTSESSALDGSLRAILSFILESSSSEPSSSGPGAERHGTAWYTGLADLTLAALKFLTSDAGEGVLAAQPLGGMGGDAAPLMLLIRSSAWTGTCQQAITAMAAGEAASLYVALVRQAASDHPQLRSRGTWSLDGRLCLGLLWVWTALPALIAADVAAAAPLLQHGHPAEWAAAKAAFATAVPQHLRRRLVSCAAAVEDALRGTPAAASAKQATEAAAAAADAAMQHLLQEEMSKTSVRPSRKALKRAAREAAAAQAAAAGQPAAPAEEAVAVVEAQSSTIEHPTQAAASLPLVAAQRFDGHAAAAMLDQPPSSAGSRMHGCWYLCAITQAVMEDPVVLEGEGWSYERTAIKAWLADHDVSPVTGDPLVSRELVANHTLRSFIQRFADCATDLTSTVRCIS